MLLEPGYHTLPESLWESFRSNHDRGRLPDANYYLDKHISECHGLRVILRRRVPKPTKLERCKVWLSDLLGTVSRPAKLVYREGAAEGFAPRTIRRALKQLGAVRITGGCRKTRNTSLGLPWNLAKCLASSLNLASSLEDTPSPSARPTTKTKPFTARRFEVMRDRAQAEQPLCNPDDAPLPDKDALSHGIGMHSLDQSSRKVVAESEWDRQEKRWDDHKKQWVPKVKDAG